MSLILIYSKYVFIISSHYSEAISLFFTGSKGVWHSRNKALIYGKKTLRTSVVSQLTIRSPSRVSEYGGRIKQKPVISAMTNTDCCNNLYFLQTPSVLSLLLSLDDI